jgi:hypothetical protein
MREWANSDMLNQYGTMFFKTKLGQGSSSSAPPPPPPFVPPHPDVAGSSHFMEQEQPPPPPPPEQDWGALFSAKIFWYNPYYNGTDSAPLVHFFKITISESIYLNSPTHWKFDISQLGGSSHPGDRSHPRMDLRDSDRWLHLLQALLGCLLTKGEKIGLKTYLVWLPVLHRSDRCLLADG